MSKQRALWTPPVSGSPSEEPDRGVRITPPWFVRELARRYAWGGAFTLDAAAHPWNAHAARFYTAADDALSVDCWTDPDLGPAGTVVYLNPPWDNVGPFLVHAAEQVRLGYVAQVVCLLPARTGTDWYTGVVQREAVRVIHPRGRLAFLYPADLTAAGEEVQPGLFGQTDARPPEKSRPFEYVCVPIFEQPLLAA